MSPRSHEQNEKMRKKTLAKITSAALEVFAEYGYYGTTIKKITTATGLSYGLVYHYFPSKAKIFNHLVNMALDKSISTINKALEVGGTAWEKIRNLSAVLVRDALTGESSLYFIIMIQALTQGKTIAGLLETIRERSVLHYQKMVPLILEAQKSGEVIKGDAVVLATAYFSFIQGLALSVIDGNGMEKRITPNILTNILRNKGADK